MDPFGRLPLEIREMIISNFDISPDMWFICRASPVFWHQLHTSKLLKTWHTLRKELGYEMLAHVLMLVQYPKIEEPIPKYIEMDGQGMPNVYFRDPLFTPQQHLIFEMHDRYQGMLNCFALGPELVPLYRDKYPDACLGKFSDYLAKSFGEHGEQLPTVMLPVESRMSYRLFYLLLAIEMMDQCPSAFVTALREPPKQLSIKEERSLRLVDCWIQKVPGSVSDGCRRFYDLPEESEEEEDDNDNREEEEEEEEEEQREAEEMVFIQC
ncbi:hypothetical protein BFJ70_g4195 [Fusarium oxysporum]|nr:hypothetical protein BFJ70_g4195 [Fusarium oxysporum]